MKPISSLPALARAHLVAALFAASGLLHGQDLDFALPPPPLSTPDSFGGTDLLAPAEFILAATRPTISYSYAEARGLLSAPGVRRETALHTVSATFSTKLAETFLLEYRPMWTTYSDDAFEDTFSHTASVEGGVRLTDWTLHFRHRYYRSSVPLFETGRQTQLESHSTVAGAQRRLSEKTTLDLNLHQNIRLVEQFSDFREWISDNELNHRLSSVITASGGFAYGYVDLDGGRDMSYQQYRARLRWRPTQRIQMDVRGGLESRSVSGSGMDRTNTPVYGATILYMPGETTTLRITGEREQTPSFFQDQLVRSTSWGAEITQRLLGRLFLTVGSTHRTRSYRPTTATILTSREDRGRGYQVSLGATVFTRGTAAVFYQEHRNRSSTPGFNATSSRAGIELRYAF